MPTPIVEVDDIRRSFGATQALAGVSLAIQAGTVHGLVGENGAGKSTLGKVIAGVVLPDSGTIRIAGEERHFSSPRDAIAAGVTAIQQEVRLVPAATVTQNVLLGLEPARAGFTQRSRMRKRMRELLDQTGFDLDPDRPVRSLSLADQQKVEILRGIATDARVLVMDEPTASLGAEEKTKLAEIVRDLRSRGTTIIYVSHFLDEVLDIADDVTVLRDGSLVRTSPAAHETTDTLVEAMLGRKLTRIFPDKRAPEIAAPVTLSVRNLSYEPSVRDVSFDVRAGEILGIAGLDGSGREQLARVVFGELRARAGTLELDGKAVDTRSPRRSMSAGMGFVPAERGAQGLILDQSILANVVLPWLGDVSRGGMLGPRAGEAKVKRLVEEVAVRPPNVKARIGGLSGGNQQKALFAKWIYAQPRVLLVNEPTRGVDIDGKHAIYELLAGLADQGMALVVASSDMEEILGLCHRVLVISRGRTAAELVDKEITEEAVMAAAFNDTGKQ